MATAIAQQVPGTLTATENSFSIQFQLFFNGSDVGAGGSDISETTVEFPYDATNAQLKSVVADAAQSEATRLGYTVADGDIILTATPTRA